MNTGTISLGSTGVQGYRQVGGYLESKTGDKYHPHIGSSKVCTGKFFNTDRVLQHPVLVESSMATLLAKAQGNGLLLGDVDIVVGPAMGAIIPAFELARQINHQGRDEDECLCAYVLKTPDDGMEFSRGKIKPGMRVLMAEDVNATGRSIKATKKTIISAGGIVLPHVLMFVDRTESDEIDGLKVTALISHYVEVYAPSKCPFCAAGSKPLDAKVDGNWERLIGEAA